MENTRIKWSDIDDIPYWIVRGVAPDSEKVNGKRVLQVDEIPTPPNPDTIYIKTENYGS